MLVLASIYEMRTIVQINRLQEKKGLLIRLMKLKK
jgi:hypothetical protein